MGGRGVDLSDIANRHFRRVGKGFDLVIDGENFHVEDIEPIDPKFTGSPLRAYTSDAYRLKNRDGDYSQVVLFNPQIEENGIRSRQRKVSYEWDKNTGNKDCPPYTVHKHLWENDVKDREHRAITEAEYLALKDNAGFPDFVKYKVETEDGYIIK